MSWEMIVNRKMNQAYRGPAELCAYQFSLWPEQIPGTTWTAQQIVNAHNSALQDEGSILLELRMWEDKEPTWTTDYYVEVVASASPLAWGLIIAAVFVLLLIAGVSFILVKVENISEYSPAAIPLMSIAAIALFTAVGLYFIRGTARSITGR